LTINYYPVGGSQPHHALFSDLAWYTPFSSLIVASSALGTYQSVSGGLIAMCFSGCVGQLYTIFYDMSGNPFIYDYDTKWTFPLTASAYTIGSGIFARTFGANTNNPFQIGQATTTQSGSGPAPTGINGPIITGGTGSSTFPATSIGLPSFF
jgi:hypothetical protein